LRVEDEFDLRIIFEGGETSEKDEAVGKLVYGINGEED